jgi:hypothetical protein
VQEGDELLDVERVAALSWMPVFRHGDGATQLAGWPPPTRTGPATDRPTLSSSSEHKAIAEYWADGPGSETPPGHWCLHAQHVSARDGHGLDEDARLFFALTAALLDAGIASWDAKRTYDSMRPITAIRFLFSGREVLAWGGPGLGPRRIRGEDRQPYIPTPPFGEYVSGHSTFSAAAVLAGFTGLTGSGPRRPSRRAARGSSPGLPTDPKIDGE